MYKYTHTQSTHVYGVKLKIQVEFGEGFGYSSDVSASALCPSYLGAVPLSLALSIRIEI